MAARPRASARRARRRDSMAGQSIRPTPAAACCSAARGGGGSRRRPARESRGAQVSSRPRSTRARAFSRSRLRCSWWSASSRTAHQSPPPPPLPTAAAPPRTRPLRLARAARRSSAGTRTAPEPALDQPAGTAPPTRSYSPPARRARPGQRRRAGPRPARPPPTGRPGRRARPGRRCPAGCARSTRAMARPSRRRTKSK